VSRAQQQSHAKPILKLRDRFRDGGLADMQLLCCAGERAGLDDPDKDCHRGPAIHVHSLSE
jgi:hypothetical protein